MSGRFTNSESLMRDLRNLRVHSFSGFYSITFNITISLSKPHSPHFSHSKDMFRSEAKP
ncbi:hypothetical protein FISHEDRAFT_76358 [Fistulina hepatica ATCC 64428]|uniref:Uncharacterized protein n=1 Tax=Fistulina hepatica ATCC 64428 TaxID=1128425 RepID=A0A0D7A536_9AGAR|nr:hypothetical protein FISHEDRAFT_76358 [Fistulina hepatica ATCC 64428]